MSSEGLFGSDTSSNLPRVFVAELLGTAILVAAGTSVPVAAVLQQSIAGPAADSLAVALTFGFALIVLVNTFGHISGAHFNPAVTVALWVIGKFPLKYVAPYLAAQLLGAVLGSIAVLWMYGQQAKAKAQLGVTQPADGVDGWLVFFIELFCTAVLVCAIVSVATDKRANSAIPGLTIGLVLCVGVIAVGPLTGAGINPARVLGPMLVSGQWHLWYAYVGGELIGGVLGALFYDKFLRGAAEPSEAEAS